VVQFELLAAYEGSYFRQAKQVRLLIDPFILPDYEGTWRRLFSKIKRHVILGVTKSLTGLQRHKFTHRDLGAKVGGSPMGMQGGLGGRGRCRGQGRSQLLSWIVMKRRRRKRGV